MIFRHADQSTARSVAAGVGISPGDIRGDRDRLARRIETVQSLIGIVDKEQRIIRRQIGPSAIFVNACASIKGGGKPIVHSVVGSVTDHNRAPLFRRAAFAPRDVAVPDRDL